MSLQYGVTILITVDYSLRIEKIEMKKALAHFGLLYVEKGRGYYRHIRTKKIGIWIHNHTRNEIIFNITVTEGWELEYETST